MPALVSGVPCVTVGAVFTVSSEADFAAGRGGCAAGGPLTVGIVWLEEGRETSGFSTLAVSGRLISALFEELFDLVIAPELDEATDAGWLREPSGFDRIDGGFCVRSPV